MAFPDYGVWGKHKKIVYLNSIIMYNKLYFISARTKFDIQIITYIYHIYKDRKNMRKDKSE